MYGTGRSVRPGDRACSTGASASPPEVRRVRSRGHVRVGQGDVRRPLVSTRSRWANTPLDELRSPRPRLAAWSYSCRNGRCNVARFTPGQDVPSRSAVWWRSSIMMSVPRSEYASARTRCDGPPAFRSRAVSRPRLVAGRLRVGGAGCRPPSSTSSRASTYADDGGTSVALRECDQRKQRLQEKLDENPEWQAHQMERERAEQAPEGQEKGRHDDDQDRESPARSYCIAGRLARDDEPAIWAGHQARTRYPLSHCGPTPREDHDPDGPVGQQLFAYNGFDTLRSPRLAEDPAAQDDQLRMVQHARHSGILGVADQVGRRAVFQRRACPATPWRPSTPRRARRSGSSRCASSASTSSAMRPWAIMPPASVPA